MKKYLIQFILLMIIINAFIITFGQNANNNSQADRTDLLRKDFSIYRNSLEQIHPALYRYTDKQKMDQLFEKGYASINKDMNDMQFFMLLKFMTGAVEDGHLIINLPREIIQKQLDTAKVFPLRLWFIGEKAFVYCHQDPRFQAGTEIISIDNKPIGTIRKTFFSYVTSDAGIQSKKYWAFNAGEATFPFLYYWLYGEKPSFEIKYRTNIGKVEYAVIASRNLKGDECFFEKKPVDNYLTLDFTPRNVAVLTIKTFNMNRLNEDDTFFQKFLAGSFEEINKRKVRKLIIDVRNNGGGEDSNGSLLYAYLTDKPFPYYSSLETISEKLPKEIHPNLEIQKPQKNNFKGICYFLINGKSFSTTSEFTAIAKSNNRGIFIGEETGGGYYGNTGSEQAIIDLPNSKIKLIIPKRKYVLAVKKTKFKDRGTIPDHILIPDINAVLHNKDVQLAYALRLANGR